MAYWTTLWELTGGYSGDAGLWRERQGGVIKSGVETLIERATSGGAPRSMPFRNSSSPMRNIWQISNLGIVQNQQLGITLGMRNKTVVPAGAYKALFEELIPWTFIYALYCGAAVCADVVPRSSPPWS